MGLNFSIFKSEMTLNTIEKINASKLINGDSQTWSLIQLESDILPNRNTFAA